MSFAEAGGNKTARLGCLSPYPVEKRTNTAMSNEQKQNEVKQGDNRAERQSEQRGERAGVILVELGNDEQNLNPYLRSLSDAFRGITRETSLDVTVTDSPENRRFPKHLPGFRIEVDIRNRRVTVYDPLTRPEGEKARESLLAYLEKPFQGVPKRRYTPFKDIVIENCMNNQLVEWLDELRTLVNANHAQLRKGEFPASVGEYREAERLKAMELQYGKASPMPQLV